jgi:phage terminase large subunit
VWDLGHADSTAIWFVQMVGFEYRIIDFYQAHAQKLAHYAKVLQEKPYVYGNTWLPHDATHQLLGAPLTISQQLREHKFRTRIVPKISVAQGIEAARTVFAKCWFDADKTSDGLQSLRHYRYEIKRDGESYAKEPLHDWSSHAADAFRYLAIAMREDPKFASQPSAYSDYDPLAGTPSGGRYGRTEETAYDPLR